MKLNIGSGSAKIEDFINVDVVPLPGVDVVASADKLPYEDNSVDEILTEHMIEHLTFEEFNRAIVEWFRILKPGGTLTVECPDLLGVCKAFVEANDYNQYTSFKGYWPLIAHIYGHQRGSSQAEKWGQVHKSGYTEQHLVDVFLGVGFRDVEHGGMPRKANPHSPTLRLKAIK